MNSKPIIIINGESCAGDSNKTGNCPGLWLAELVRGCLRNLNPPPPPPPCHLLVRLRIAATNCITMDRLELERFTPDGKVLLESYKDNVLGQIGQQAGPAVRR